MEQEFEQEDLISRGLSRMLPEQRSREDGERQIEEMLEW